MNLLGKIAGGGLYALAKLLAFVLDVLINIIGSIVKLVRNLARGFAGLIGLGGCLLIFFFAGPFGLFLLFHPLVLLIILFFVVFPLLGGKFVSYLKYIRYISTEYLFDRANYFMSGTSARFQSFEGYKNYYRQMEDEKIRRERQRRQAEQAREWEEMFRRFYEQQANQGHYQGQGQYHWQGQGTGYNQQAYANPATAFKREYEAACDILGVGYQADKYEIRLAYRQKAKEYHPDLNKSPSATEMFQKVNNAYEFLSDANISRYQSI